MDRNSWLVEKQRETEERYDAIWAPLYGEKFGLYENETHQQFIQKFLSLLPPRSALLDAACGAGRYLPMLLGKGHTVTGIDQSRGMLAHAKERFPGVKYEKVSLQEITYREVFDGAICIDAMEHVPPEDWPCILKNFHRALRALGVLYFTVEIAGADEIEEAYQRAKKAGLPVVYGELADGDVYHFYPALEKVRDWISQAGFEKVEEGEGSGYDHFLLRKTTG